jgi:hypothetical protein
MKPEIASGLLPIATADQVKLQQSVGTSAKD